MRILEGVQTEPVECEGNHTESPSDAEPVRSLVGGRRNNRRSQLAISVSTRPMTSDEEAGAAEALIGLVARLVRGRLQKED